MTIGTTSLPNGLYHGRPDPAPTDETRPGSRFTSRYKRDPDRPFRNSGSHREQTVSRRSRQGARLAEDHPDNHLGNGAFRPSGTSNSTQGRRSNRHEIIQRVVIAAVGLWEFRRAFRSVFYWGGKRA